MEDKRMTGPKYLIHVITFIFLLGIDLADFICDWLFFTDVSSAEKGLVYGVPDKIIVRAILAFCIVGSVTFILEIVNLWKEFFHQKTRIDSDVLSAIVIWIEDVPQIALSLALAVCREEPISVFQLGKAVVVTLGILIRIFVLVVKFCNKRLSKNHLKIKFVIAAGSLVELSCAVAIFILIHTEKGNKGDVTFRVPTTILENQFKDASYFNNVSVFINHPVYFDNVNPNVSKVDNVVNWLQLTSINQLRARPNMEVSFKLEYTQVDNGALRLAIWRKNLHETDLKNKWMLSSCFDMDKKSPVIQQKMNTSCSNTSSMDALFLTFKYDPPGYFFKRKIYGNIFFNARYMSNGTCEDVGEYSDEVRNQPAPPVNLTMHYFRTNETLPRYDDHVMRVEGVARFYRNVDEEMIDVTRVWRTGWFECEAAGYVGPTLDSELKVDCS
ncbi:uncharacterized protein LOC131957299 [Physella acuta]|uniref:uncharacterized protein LOC131957299 n=1 Tax=Physella acuta TaxID=109671 RepID=UPI0027DDB683|nr:uncharacterized protein LOC131957299 [Physella acuta]